MELESTLKETCEKSDALSTKLNDIGNLDHPKPPIEPTLEKFKEGVSKIDELKVTFYQYIP